MRPHIYNYTNNCISTFFHMYIYIYHILYLIWAKLLHSSDLFGSFLPAPGENGRKCLGRDALHGDHQHGRILETSEHGTLVPFKGNETIGKTTGKVVKTIETVGKSIGSGDPLIKRG